MMSKTIVYVSSVSRKYDAWSCSGKAFSKKWLTFSPFEASSRLMASWK